MVYVRLLFYININNVNKTRGFQVCLVFLGFFFFKCCPGQGSRGGQRLPEASSFSLFFLSSPEFIVFFFIEN